MGGAGVYYNSGSRSTSGGSCRCCSIISSNK